MIALLDASVLIALGDAGHVHESAAMRFFDREAGTGGCATCPTTENAFLRILSHPSYPRTLGSLMEARRVLSRLMKALGEIYWVSVHFPAFPRGHGLRPRGISVASRPTP